MPPNSKRKNNNNKKRRAKSNTTPTPNLTPDASPSKVIPHSPTTTPTPEDHSTPIKSSHPKSSIQLKLQAEPLINQNQNESPHPILPDSVHNSHVGPIPPSHRSINLPGSIPKSAHQKSDESSIPIQSNITQQSGKQTPELHPSAESALPIKSTINKPSGKQTPEVHRVKDSNYGESTENSANSKTSDLLNKPNRNHHTANRRTDRVLKEIPNGSYKQPRSHHDQSDQTPVKPLEDSTKSPIHHSNSLQKPIKHVKFTKNANNNQSPNTKNQENHTNEQNDSIESNREADKKLISQKKQNSIRRELSGAADLFDFDAQQRQYAGPGGGMVKKPRHDQNDSHRSLSSNSSTGEPNQVLSDSSPSESRDEPSHPNLHNMGYQHAQGCQLALAQAQHVDQPNETTPDLLQIYLSYFDQNQDGLLDPFDTWQAFRRLRFGLILATIGTIALHTMMIPFIVLGLSDITDNLGIHYLPVARYLFQLTCNLIHFIETRSSRYICLDRKDHRYPDTISPSTLWKETQNHVGLGHMTDPIGWLRVVFGWMIAVAVTRPSDLTVKYDLIDGVYNGEVLFLVAQAQDLSS